jgi:type II secretory ATPase GspE/PulE/Tfp pilus assembly ATPase PilB-like protein
MECNSYGYKGRTGVFEVATVDAEIGTLISAGTHHRELVDCLRRKGVRSMVHDGLKKAAAGVITIEEVSRVCGLGAGPEVAQPPTPLAPVEMVTR